MLGHGSGFDSPGFRAIQQVTPRARRRLPRGARGAPASTLVEVYIHGREHEELYQLAELPDRVGRAASSSGASRHFVVVERIIGGAVVGTQGTPVEVLGRLIHKRYFPELWEVRNELTALSQSAQ